MKFQTMKYGARQTNARFNSWSDSWSNSWSEVLSKVLLVSLMSTAWWLPAGAADAPAPVAVPEQDSGTVDDQPDSDTQQDNTDRPLSGSEQRRANDKGGVFRPSESISEDLSITFPVDI